MGLIALLSHEIGLINPIYLGLIWAILPQPPPTETPIAKPISFNGQLIYWRFKLNSIKASEFETNRVDLTKSYL